MILEKYLNLNKPRIEKSVVGLTKDQFLRLSESFNQTYHEMQNERLVNGDIRRLPKGGALGMLDTPSKNAFLYFVLYENIVHL